jgi:hypothetical protein
MQRLCNSWRVRNLHVMVLRLNKSLKYDELLPTVGRGSRYFATRVHRPSTKFFPFLQGRLHSSHVIDNAREDAFLLPQIFMLKEVHLRGWETQTYQITSSLTSSS